MQHDGLPTLSVPRAPWSVRSDPATWSWETVPALSPFVLADGSAPAQQQTWLRVCCDDDYLYARFDCDDSDIRGSYTRRDEPLYDEEVVEIFLSPGAVAPAHYYELELSPNGVLFDALITNPGGDRDAIVVDSGWDCPGLRWDARRDDAAQRWSAVLAIPWRPLHDDTERPVVWRANFYRIERTHGAAAEFSCWSPTLTEPADFHRPERFGVLWVAGETRK